MQTTTIGQIYKIQATLGAGGMGTVYRGIDTRDESLVAIKQLKPELAQPEMIERFRREGQALRNLNHPNIVKLLDTIQEDGQHYLIMEYVSGGDLTALLYEERMPLEQLLAYAIDLADALTRAHKLNIIHRDLKPANVLIGEDGVLRLTDFGVAFDMTKQRVTAKEGLVGTAEYLAPETINGQDIDNRTDIWAFGIMLFEMLTGKTPFADRSLTAIVRNILENPLPDLENLCPDIPIALIDLVYRMLEKDRNARIASVRYVGAELEDILHGRDNPTQRNNLALTTEDLSLIKHNLPAESTPFIGRETEIETLTNFLSNPATRLVTILGMGGMGKTRLALETARQNISLDRSHPSPFSDGIYFIPLAPLNSANAVILTLAESIQFSFYAAHNPQQQLLDFLREKSILLVMDNFEHVLDAADLVQDILATAPHVKIIVTSRERLNLRGETVFNIGGMDGNEWDSVEAALNDNAVKLFLQSARRVQPSFDLAPADLPHLTRIFQIVQGMPLGIELAAAWVDALHIEEIAQEIQQNRNFLETEMRDVPDRHRSIRAVFDYSWALLAENERDIFAYLSVFRGGFTRDAAIAVTGIGLRTLTTLANKSLISRDSNGRYHIHALIREYAMDMLKNAGQDDILVEAHADYFAAFLNQILPDYSYRSDPTVLKQVAADIDNFRTAWQWAVDHQDVEKLTQMTLGFQMYFQMTGQFRDGFEIYKKVITVLENAETSLDKTALLVEMQTHFGWLAIRIGEIAEAKAAFERSYEHVYMVDLPAGHFEPMGSLGMVYNIMGDYEKAIAFGKESLDYSFKRGDDANAMSVYYVLTGSARNMGDYQAAKDYAAKGLALCDKIDDTWFRSYIHVDLGGIERAEGNYTAAKYHYQIAYDIRKNIFKDPRRNSAFPKHLGQIALLEGNPQEALPLFEESVRNYENIGDRAGLATALTGLGQTLTALQEYEQAKRQLQRALRLLVEMNAPPLILSTLVVFSRLLLQRGDTEQGHEILGVVLNHPQTNQETQDEAEAVLAEYGDENHEVLAQNKILLLDMVVTSLLN